MAVTTMPVAPESTDLSWLTNLGNHDKYHRLVTGGYGGGKDQREGPLYMKDMNSLPPCELRPKQEKRPPSRLDVVEARLDAIERKIDRVEAIVSEVLCRLPWAPVAH